jgi:hypothetical protein
VDFKVGSEAISSEKGNQYERPAKRSSLRNEHELRGNLWHRRWACWQPLQYLFGLGTERLPTAQSCITTMTNAAYSAVKMRQVFVKPHRLKEIR